LKQYNEIFKDIPAYSRFLKVDEIDELIKQITQIPGVKHRVIGNTINDEPLIMLEIGNSEKTALINGVPHSDEPLGSLVVTFFARWLAMHSEQNYFGWRWLFIPILEKRGMRLNEGWFNMPDSFAALAKSNFREPTEDQYEWTFPIEYDQYHWTKSRPESLAVKKILEQEKPDLLCNLHHCGFHNAYYYLSKDMSEVYSDLTTLAKICRMPLSDTAPDVPFGKMFSPGFYQMYGLKDYLDYYKDKDPSVLTTIKRGACSDEWYHKKVGGFSFNCEVPMYITSKLQDKKPSNKNYKKINEERYLRKKSRLKYSIKLLNILRNHTELADPLLLDVAEKHVVNAQNSLDHEKKLLLKTEEKIVTKAEIFENVVLADLFDLFFMGQIWRVAESICIKGGVPEICQLMESLDIEIKSLGKSVQERGKFYQLPIKNSVKMQLGSILIIADVLKNKK
jgi:hypothetical protein